MRKSSGVWLGLWRRVIGGLGAGAAHAGPSGLVPAAVTVPCPALGHKGTPDTNGWTTQFVALPVRGTVTAQISGSTLLCTYTATPVSGVFPPIAKMTKPLAASVCVASPRGASPRRSRSAGASAQHTDTNVACPPEPPTVDSLGGSGRGRRTLPNPPPESRRWRGEIWTASRLAERASRHHGGQSPTRRQRGRLTTFRVVRSRQGESVQLPRLALRS